jgi:hypothetical protein
LAKASIYNRGQEEKGDKKKAPSKSVYFEETWMTKKAFNKIVKERSLKVEHVAPNC